MSLLIKVEPGLHNTYFTKEEVYDFADTLLRIGGEIKTMCPVIESALAFRASVLDIQLYIQFPNDNPQKYCSSMIVKSVNLAPFDLPAFIAMDTIKRRVGMAREEVSS